MGLKKNIGYNTLLTLSNYLIPLLVFPYVSRILGVNNLGIYSFVDSIINYFILFSMMGITTVGIREIARSKKSKQDLSDNFSSLFVLNSITTFVVFIIFIAVIFIFPQFTEHKKLFYIGGAKILANLFLIEWLYKGMEDFKFITLRTIAVKMIYVLLVFFFVKEQDDYDIYYALTVGSTIINAVINWFYSKNITFLSFARIKIRPIIKPFLILGIYGLLTSMYTSFNIVYLGFVAGEKEVGLYTTAIKIQAILLSLYTAYSNVVMPHISSMIAQKRNDEVKTLINKSIDALYIFCIPIIYSCFILAPHIIFIISGSGYEGAILPMRIVMPLILVIGLEQILIIQILTPLRHDRYILRNSINGALTGLILNIILVPRFSSVGSSIVWVASETVVLVSAIYFVNKKVDINLNFDKLLKHLILGIPYGVICLIFSLLLENHFYIIIFSFILCFLYLIIIQSSIFKNELIYNIYLKITNKKIY